MSTKTKPAASESKNLGFRRPYSMEQKRKRQERTVNPASPEQLQALADKFRH